MKSSAQTLAFFAKFIEDELGIVYKEGNYYQLDTRLQEVAQQSGFMDSDALFEHTRVRMDPRIKLMILDIATNNETLFFRDPRVFETIESEVSAKVKSSPNQKLDFKIWSAACSYGQEVYTLAIILDKLKLKFEGLTYSILATDISTRALTAAEQGRYTQLQVQRGLPAMILVKHFQKLEAGQDKFDWEIKSHLKNHISFSKLNLLEPFGAIGKFDLVLCRNVLIYQNIERKMEILGRIFERLNPGGALFLGAAESLIGINDDFEMVRTDKVTYYRRPDRLAVAS